ncbi:MAG: hypothetical protein ABR538_06660 [Candidatus Binatia bacterium]
MMTRRGTPGGRRVDGLRVQLLKAAAGLAAAVLFQLPCQSVIAHVGDRMLDAPAAEPSAPAATQLVQRRTDGIGSATKGPQRGSSAELFGGSSADRYGGTSADKGGVAGPRDRRHDQQRIPSSRSNTNRRKPVETGDEQDEREQ